MRRMIILGGFLFVLATLIVASRYLGGGTLTELTFTEACLKDGNMWHAMKPLRQGKELEGESKPGCMTADGANHFSDYAEYTAAKNPGNSTVTLGKLEAEAGTQTTLRFSVRDAQGTVPELYREHERYLHVIVISRDMSVFRHVHPDDQSGFTLDDVQKGELAVPFTFPKAGEYLIAVDYANQLRHESRQFRVQVGGYPQQTEIMKYSSPADFGGVNVVFHYSSLLSGTPSVIRYSFSKDSAPVMDIVPYLGAAMHIAVVKNDLSEFVHTHGEWHPPGYVASQNVSLSHVHTPPPEKFGPTVEAHVLFPSPGLYTIFGEFKRGTSVTPTKFTVQVD